MRAACALVLAGLLATSGQPRRNAPALTGTWRVAKFCMVDTLGELFEPFGADPNGLFVYGRDGRLSIQISRTAKTTNDAIVDDAVIAEELHMQRDGYLGYYGTYTITSDSTVIHHVVGGSVPGYVGTDQRRIYHIRGDTLSIGTQPRTFPCRVLLRVSAPAPS